MNSVIIHHALILEILSRIMRKADKSGIMHDINILPQSLIYAINDRIKELETYESDLAGFSEVALHTITMSGEKQYFTTVMNDEHRSANLYFTYDEHSIYFTKLSKSD